MHIFMTISRGFVIITHLQSSEQPSLIPIPRQDHLIDQFNVFDDYFFNDCSVIAWEFPLTQSRLTSYDTIVYVQFLSDLSNNYFVSKMDRLSYLRTCVSSLKMLHDIFAKLLHEQAILL